jgi:hypothetical protein
MAEADAPLSGLLPWATAWAAEHPHVTGRILTQAEAVTAGEATFGPVLTAPP